MSLRIPGSHPTPILDEASVTREQRILILAGAAEVAPATVARFIDGLPIRPVSQRRIIAAILRIGWTAP